MENRRGAPDRRRGEAGGETRFFERNMAEVVTHRQTCVARSRFSLVIDTTGDPGVIESLPGARRRRGNGAPLRGNARRGRVSVDAHAIHYHEVSIVGSFHYTPREADEALALLARGAVPVAEIVSARRPLAGWRGRVRPRPERRRDEGLSRSMKAVLVRSLDDISVVEMEAPRPGPGEIVVAMKAVGICGSDIDALVRRDEGARRPRPRARGSRRRGRRRGGPRSPSATASSSTITPPAASVRAAARARTSCARPGSRPGSTREASPSACASRPRRSPRTRSAFRTPFPSRTARSSSRSRAR